MKTSRTIQDLVTKLAYQFSEGTEDYRKHLVTDYFKVENIYQEGGPNAVRLDRP